jgi:hypothetical protein
VEEETTISEGDTTFAEVSDRNSGATHTLGINDTRSLFYVNVSPSVSVRENWVDREFSASDTTKGFNRAATWSASVGVNTQVFGNFGGLGPVQAIRHTLRPAVSFTYQPEFGNLTFTDENGFRRNRYPGISAFERRSASLGITNRLQAKVSGEEGIRRINLFNWDLGTSYDFVEAERVGGRPWSDVSSRLDFERILGVDVGFNSSHDPYESMRFRNFTLNATFGFRGRLPGAEQGNVVRNTGAGFRGRDGWDAIGADLYGGGNNRPVGSQAVDPEDLSWNASFGLSYTGSRADEDFPTQARLRSNGGLQISKNWSVTYSNLWDITQGRITSESISLRRDLHCWEAEFSRNRIGGDTQFWFRINVKGMESVKYEQGLQGSGLGGLGGLTSALP